MEQRIDKFLQEREDKGLLRHITPVIPFAGSIIHVKGREYINFSSNDYLGLSSHIELIKAARSALEPVFSSSASRLMTGTVNHHDLEERIAAFKCKEDSLVFNSGYQANTGVISSLAEKGDAVFCDRLSHASIIDGIRLSGATLFRFRHNDTSHLEELLKKERYGFRNALIVTESVFSMDGDIAPLPELCRLKESYNCLFMVDEAHATGIFGKNGSGMVEQTGTQDAVDIIMGTFGKALGGFGSYVAVSKKIKDFLVNTCRSFIYSTALPPSVIAANIASLELIHTEPFRRQTLLTNADYMRYKLKKNNFEIGGDSQIIPIFIGGSKDAVLFSDSLKEKGFWTTPVRPPTVPEGKARIRLSLTFDHKKEVIDRFINDITSLRTKQ